MKNLEQLLKQKQTLLNQLSDLNKQIYEVQSNQLKELQNFKSNNSILESIRDELLITLNDSDINQFLTTFA